MDISKVPSWIIAVSLAILVMFVILLYSTEKHFCYGEKIGFVHSNEVCTPGIHKEPIILNVSRIYENDTDQPFYITGYCQPTTQRKDLEGYISKTRENLNKSNYSPISSMSGSDRIAISFSVPPRWYYTIKRSEVDGVKCYFQGMNL